MTFRVNVFQAGDLIDKAYRGKLGSRVLHKVDVAGVQAYYLKDGTLVIPGTNERSDWRAFNLDIEPAKGDSGRFFHRGFLTHAQLVYMFAKPLKPKCIIGHSLGAASAQIVGRNLKVPTIALASPKVLSGAAKLPGEGWVANFLRRDDMVCHMPPGIGRRTYRHMGSRYWMAPEGIHTGGDHQVKHYMDILREERYATLIPKDWPK